MCSWVLGGCWSCRRGCREYGRAPCVSQTCLCCPAQARQVFYLTSQCVFSGLCPCRSYTSYETQLCLFIFCDFVLTLSMFLALPGRRFNLSSFFTFASLLSLCADVLGLEAAPRQEGHPCRHGSWVCSSHLRGDAESLGVSHLLFVFCPGNLSACKPSFSPA